MKSPTSSIVLGKRRRQPNLVLNLSGGSICESDNDAISDLSLSDGPVASTSKVRLSTAPIIVNGKLVVDDRRRYCCTYEGCSKSYRKPCRLEEHERVHTGERPFSCTTCQKTYLRESHLQAHMRSHLPETARSYICTRENCEKKFWTPQHLKRHEELHEGEKPFKCTEDRCLQAFSKHSQLRSHFATAHCPPGTKPYLCEHTGCIKSFSTNQKLKIHAKTHHDRRYICSQLSCTQKETQEYFSTWTALQAHSRTAHPATCPYPSCQGKTFSQHKGLRAHLKLHEQQEVEEALAGAAYNNNDDADDEEESRPVKRRRGGEVGREWKCEEEGCVKDFKSKRALTTHVNVKHLRRRDFVCTVDACGSSFGYKHLLQRHVARMHAPEETAQESCESSEENEAEKSPFAPSALQVPQPQSGPLSTIDILTGKAYGDRAKDRIALQGALICPFPNVPLSPCLSLQGVSDSCKHVFSRAYDLKRHLISAHDLEVSREEAIKMVATLRHEGQARGAPD
ncbi:hypothetical protein DFH11DRAFT_1859986 [Phellopilus nigrolimitatus]|nr:hypothetical protein DFH11DRAFT_1859986 [Phellopilus nigrolimitatus]